MECPKQNVVSQINQQKGAQQLKQFSIFGCLFVNDMNHVSLSVNSLVFQLATPKADSYNNWEKLEKACMILFPRLWPPTICPLFTKDETITARLGCISVKT